MKHRLKPSLWALSAFCLTLSCFSIAGVQAKGISGLDEIKEALDQHGSLEKDHPRARQRQISTSSIGFHESGQVETASLLPEKFDLRAVDKDGDGKTENYVSSIKYQHPWGTCWAFGAIAAVEATLAYQYDTPVEPDNELDLSEKHLSYFSYKPIEEGDPNGQGGEGFHFMISTGINKEMRGGDPGYATSLFSSGIGPVMESDAPYRGKEGNFCNINAHIIKDGKLYDNHGNEFEGESLEPFAYSPYDDWSVEEELRFVNYFTLKNSTILPEPVIVEEDDSGKVSYSTDEKAIEAVKKELVEGRAVSCCYCSDQSEPQDGLENTKYLDTQNWAHYTYDGTLLNHMVCIVGYDDTYSKENFLPGHQPPKDGAFICKNSWGGIGAEFPGDDPWGIDGTGYFYLSYYDTSLCQLESYDFEYRDDLSEKAYNIGQYDLMPSSQIPDVSTTAPSLMANVFKAPSDILIHALSTQTATANTTVTFDLYRLNKDYENPMDGELVCSSTKRFPYAGYHRIELDKSYAFVKDSPLSIVVTTKRADGSYEINYDQDDSKLYIQRNNLLYPDEFVNPYSVGVINPGESFCAGADERGEMQWQDWKEVIDQQSEKYLKPLQQAGYLEALEAGDVEKVKKIEQEVPVDDFVTFTYDNFPIKYYADFVEDEIPFKDLGLQENNPHWALLSGDIPAVLSKGLMSGKSQKIFAPDDALKRAEAAMTLFRLSGESDPDKISTYFGPSTFKDVNISAWYGPAMNWAAQNGIFVGSNGYAKPDDPISRQELALILYRYANKMGADCQDKPDSSYENTPDADEVSNWAKEAMAWAYKNGLITGYKPSGNLVPKGNTKRGEYAKILLATLELLEN